MKQEIPVDQREHSLCVLQRVNEMRKDQQFCDFLIKVGSEEIHAHRNILAGGSDYFRAMFSHGTKEVESGVVAMQGVDAECTILCIEYIYGEKAFVPDGKYEAMMHVAVLMQLHSICNGLISMLMDNLTPDLFVPARNIARFYNCDSLREKCNEVAEIQFSAVSKEENFVELEKGFVKEMLQSTHVRMSEEEKLDAVLRWIKYEEERTEFAIEMLKTVLLLDVPIEFRRWLVENDPMISGDIETTLIFYNSIIETEKRAKQKSAIAVFDKISGYIQCFDPRSGSWKRMQGIHDDLSGDGIHFSAVSISEHVYVLVSNKAVYRFDHKNGSATWERLSDFLKEHGYHPPAAVCGSYIYVIGGHFDCSSKFVERYNPLTNQWVELADKQHSSMGSELLSSRGCIYSFGGTADGKNVNRVEKYQPLSATWSELAPMGVARDHTAAVELNEKIYVFGGTCGLILDTVECYDTKTNVWTFLKSMNGPRWFFKAFAVDGKLYAVGGSWTRDSLEEYDIEKDEWKRVELPLEMRLHIRESVEIRMDMTC